MKVSEEQNLVYTVLNEAWNNPAFKEELIASPVEAVRKLTGQTMQLPEGVDRIQVVDQTDEKTWNINLPAQPNMDDVELNEEQLEIVAGGGDITPSISQILTPTFPPCFPPPTTTPPFNPFPGNSTW